MLFNSDMRGVAPRSVSYASDFSQSDYDKVMGKRIHPSFYSFDSHAARYAVSTRLDCCDAPQYMKDTVPGSLVVKLCAMGGTSIKCEVGNDAQGYKCFGGVSLSSIDFSICDLSRASFSTAPYAHVMPKDRSFGWFEKRISIFTDEFCSPFGVYSISYRYKIKGRIKQRTE